MTEDIRDFYGGKVIEVMKDDEATLARVRELYPNAGLILVNPWMNLSMKELIARNLEEQEKERQRAAVADISAHLNRITAAAKEVIDQLKIELEPADSPAAFAMKESAEKVNVETFLPLAKAAFVLAAQIRPKDYDLSEELSKALAEAITAMNNMNHEIITFMRRGKRDAIGN